MKFLLLLIFGLLLVPFVVAEEFSVPIEVVMTNGTVEVKCSGSSTVLDKTIESGTFSPNCIVDINTTTVINSTVCDLGGLADEIINRTGAEKCVIDYETIFGEVRDNRAQTINTIKEVLIGNDGASGLQGQINRMVTCTQELSVARDQVKLAEIRAVSCEGNVTYFQQRNTDLEGGNKSLLVIIVILAVLCLGALLLWLSGIGVALVGQITGRRGGSKVELEEVKK